MAIELARLFKNDNPLLIGILNGSFIFLADLIRELDFDCEVDFIKVKSYYGKKSACKISLLNDLSVPIKDRNIIIIEDIIDTGLTIDWIYNHIKKEKPKNIAIVTLLSKKSNYSLNFNIDIIGFEITSEFVVGYGLDFDHKYRNLEDIYKIKKELKGF